MTSIHSTVQTTISRGRTRSINSRVKPSELQYPDASQLFAAFEHWCLSQGIPVTTLLVVVLGEVSAAMPTPLRRAQRKTFDIEPMQENGNLSKEGLSTATLDPSRRQV